MGSVRFGEGDGQSRAGQGGAELRPTPPLTMDEGRSIPRPHRVSIRYFCVLVVGTDRRVFLQHPKKINASISERCTHSDTTKTQKFDSADEYFLYVFLHLFTASNTKIQPLLIHSYCDLQINSSDLCLSGGIGAVAWVQTPVMDRPI